MALSDFTPETKDVSYKGKTLVTVRGLNLDDVGLLMRRHLGDLQAVYRAYENIGKLLPNNQDIDALLFNFLANAPETAARMIANASGEPDNIDKARALPAPLQLKILIAIIELTFEDIGGPLEFAAMLRRITPDVIEAAVPNNSTIQ